MNTQPAFEFHWLSPLGVSVVLFLLYGGFHIFIGVLEPVVREYSTAGQGALIRGDESDAALFGQSPAQLLKDNPQYALLGKILIHWVAALLVMAGIFQISLVWFGLRQGQTWAFWSLVVGSLAVFPFWFLMFQPYARAGIPLLRWDYPPVILIPTLLFLPAVILGWIGLR